MACCLLPPCCSCCNVQIKCCGKTRVDWKWAFFAIFGASVVLSWTFRDYAAPHLTVFTALKACGTEACVAKQAVLRVSLGTCLFFSAMCALTLGVRDPGSRRGLLQRRGWALKLLCWAGLVALCFLPSNTVVEHYFQAARAGGAMFLLLQLIIILDAVVTFNEDCLERDDPCSRAKLIAGASACNAGAIAGVACMYVYLWHTDRNLAFITVTACIFALLTLLSLHPRTSGGIFTSGAVTAYCTYLCAVAIMSDPGSSGAIAQTPRWLQAVGFAIALFALVYSTATAGGNTSAQRTFDVAPGAMSGGGTDPETGEELEPGEVHPLSYSYFHFVFSLGSMYSAMLFTSWTNADTFSAWSLDKGLASMWVKVGCEWAAASLYSWILLAPLICPGRDFT